MWSGAKWVKTGSNSIEMQLIHDIQHGGEKYKFWFCHIIILWFYRHHMINPEFINIINNKKVTPKQRHTNTSYTILNVTSSSSQGQNTVSWFKRRRKKKTFCTWLSCLEQKEKQQIKQVQKTTKNKVQFTGLCVMITLTSFVLPAWDWLQCLILERQKKQNLN